MANNRVAYFEIPATEPETLMHFYSKLFGWKFEKTETAGPNYWMCETGSGPGINGGLMQRIDTKQPWMNYVHVDSIDAVIEQAVSMGATIAMPRTPIPGSGAFAALSDPDGNIFGLWEDAAKQSQHTDE